MDAYALTAEESARLKPYGAVLARAKARVESWGGRIVFVYLPEWRHFKERRRADKYGRGVLSHARRLGLEIVDVTEAFRRRARPASLFARSEYSHYNAEGYRISAEAVERELKRR